MADKYFQIKKYLLFFEEFIFETSLYFILNEKFEKKELFNDNLQFEMTFSQFKTILRFLEKNAADSCGVVCYSDNECDGHRCLNYLRQYDNFMTESVENREIFYRNIEIIKNSKNTVPMMSYIFLPKDVVNLKRRSWSQRLSYLN